MSRYPAIHVIDPFVIFLFSVSVRLCSGFLRISEDDDEVGVGVVEELVDKPGTTNGT